MHHHNPATHTTTSFKKILIFIILLGGVFSASCQTIIPGGVVSGTWTAAGAPYLVNGAIMIANDSTLTIEPGVSVEFQGNYKLLVLGRLLAIGTPADTITFTAADTTNGWLGIRFENTEPSNDTSRIAYCRIQYGKAMAASPNDCGGALYLKEFSKAVVSNSLITNCAANDDGGAICCHDSSPKILYNSIINNSCNSGGGGIYCSNGSPLILGNTITGNTASDGAAMACRYDSNPFIIDNVISNNTASNCCGGIWCYNSNSLISGNTISYNTANMAVCVVSAGAIILDNGNHIVKDNTVMHNTAAGNGSGGIFCLNGTVEITDNVFSYNTALNSSSGGGIKCAYCNASISNNIISNNTSDYDGGGIYCLGDNVVVSYNFISNNTAAMFGGGVYCRNETQHVSDNVVSNNTAGEGGGGICFSGSTADITNNTITNNDALYGGALYFKSSSVPLIQNTMLWGNTAPDGEQVYIWDDDSDPDFYYCDVQGGRDAFGLNSNVFYMGAYEHNIDSIPLFMSPSAGSGTGFNGLTADWSLQSASPCINAGNPEGAYPDFDMAGNPRVVGNVIDIGAYEYQGNTGVPVHSIQDQATVYPNPFTNAATIHVRNNPGRLQLGIYDMCGKRMKSIEHITGNKIRVERDHLIPGIYIYELRDEAGAVFTGKLVVAD